MQQKSGKLISPAQYAKLRGLNRSTIARQIAAGKIPSVDGMVNPRAADAAREKNLDQVRREQAARLKRTKQQKPAAPAESVLVGLPLPISPEDANLGRIYYRATVDTLHRITNATETLRFGRTALAMGCSREQARALGEWHSGAVVGVLDEVEVEDVEVILPPSEKQWLDALGGPQDVSEADRLYATAEAEHDRITGPEPAPAA